MKQLNVSGESARLYITEYIKEYAFDMVVCQNYEDRLSFDRYSEISYCEVFAWYMRWCPAYKRSFIKIRFSIIFTA